MTRLPRDGYKVWRTRKVSLSTYLDSQDFCPSHRPYMEIKQLIMHQSGQLIMIMKSTMQLA